MVQTSPSLETAHSQDLLKALFAACDKQIAWLGRLAVSAEINAMDQRFVSLSKAYAADAKNYRATAADLKRALDPAKAALSATTRPATASARPDLTSTPKDPNP